LRPDARRRLFGVGGFASPSEDGGRDELREFAANRARSSATSARSSAISPACSTTSA
jgi:hypothetical protein